MLSGMSAVKYIKQSLQMLEEREHGTFVNKHPELLF